MQLKLGLPLFQSILRNSINSNSVLGECEAVAVKKVELQALSTISVPMTRSTALFSIISKF